MSFKSEVVADSSGRFCSGHLAFATPQEANTYAKDLAARWALVTDWRAVESDQPVNCQYLNGRLEPVKVEA